MFFVYRLYQLSGVFYFGEVSHVRRFVQRAGVTRPHNITGLRLSESLWMLPGTCDPEEQ